MAIGGSVESLSRVLLLLLIDHDADDEAAYAAEHAEEEKEEELEAGHRRRLGVVNMVWNRMNMLMLVCMKHNSIIYVVCLLEEGIISKEIYFCLASRGLEEG